MLPGLGESVRLLLSLLWRGLLSHLLHLVYLWNVWWLLLLLLLLLLLGLRCRFHCMYLRDGSILRARGLEPDRNIGGILGGSTVQEVAV
jgi:hypothetical protein